MPSLRLLIIALTTIILLALGVFALVNQGVPGDDVLIIKGGSLEIQCGKNHGTDCLGTPDKQGKYKHKKDKSHILKVVVRDPSTGEVFFGSTFDKTDQPQIEITYKE
ncbi:MAG: hypothetical protein ACREBG_17670 [Pyrinomonadaceae bacterium]